MKKGIILFLFIGSSFFAESARIASDTIQRGDTTTLAHYFRKGKFYGHSRYFFMATENAPGQSDYFANAFGLGIGYETPRFEGFSIGMSGYFIYNIGSSDLATIDSVSGQPNRYEVGLFDIENPNNHADLDRLEDLYLRFGNDLSFIRVGKQHYSSPFINPQDGRMRPTLVEGIFSEWNEWKNWKFHSSFLWDISPRSTVKWYGIGESIGVYPCGVNPDGTKSEYSGNVDSEWLVIGGVQRQIRNSLRIQIWNQFVENVFNTALFQVDWNPRFKKDSPMYLVAGTQFVKQNTLNHGGNEMLSKTYAQPGAQARVYGFRLGLENKKHWNASLNFTRIGGEDRYLMPREWGRDPFYTFMPRERNEGYGNVKAVNAQFGIFAFKEKLRLDFAAGRYILPDVKNTELSKYGIPSYDQVNFDIRVRPEGYLHGLTFQLLIVHKRRVGEVYDAMRFVHNKVDVTHCNLVVNYHF
jgi:hypothetical protein